MADLAILLAGHVPVGLFPRQPVENIRHIMEHAQAAAIFLGPGPDAEITVSAVPAGVVTIGLPYPGGPEGALSWDTLVSIHPPLASEAYTPPLDSALVMLLYTSGTSGRPKGVMLTQGNISFIAQHALEHVFKPRGPQRLLSYLPLAHAQERLTCEGLSLLMGAEVYFLETIEAFGPTLARVAPTFFTGAPIVYERLRAAILAKIPQQQLNRLLKLPLIGAGLRALLRRKLGLHRATLCVVGGSKVPDELVAWFAKLGIIIQQSYGLTENCGYLACNLPGAQQIGSVGRILPGAEVRFGSDGEIQCRHPGTMVGYFHEPELTRQVMTEDGYFRTGDAGWMDEKGFLYVQGRLSDMLSISGGRRIAPATVENAIVSPLIDHMCLLGSAALKLVLLISLNTQARKRARPEIEAGLEAALHAANAMLAPHERVECIVVVKDAWLPTNGYLTATMKVRRAEIGRAYHALVEQVSRIPAGIFWEEDLSQMAKAEALVS
jgi:long-chain acyl-CoA synthetase